MSGVKVDVLTFGLEKKLDLFASTEGEAKRAVRSAMTKVGTRGRTLVRQKAPARTGIGKRGIKTSTRTASTLIVTRIYPSGPHAHIMKWQDQGTGRRYKRNGQYTGELEPQYFFERTETQLADLAPQIIDDAIGSAIVKSGLA